MTLTRLLAAAGCAALLAGAAHAQTATTSTSVDANGVQTTTTVDTVAGTTTVTQEIRDDDGLGKLPCDRHRESKQQVYPRHDAQGGEFLKRTHGAHLSCGAQGKPCAEYKQQLPAERVEIPPSIWKCR